MATDTKPLTDGAIARLLAAADSVLPSTPPAHVQLVAAMALRDLQACRAALRGLLATAEDVSCIELPAERVIKLWCDAKQAAREAVGESTE